MSYQAIRKSSFAFWHQFLVMLPSVILGSTFVQLQQYQLFSLLRICSKFKEEKVVCCSSRFCIHSFSFAPHFIWLEDIQESTRYVLNSSLHYRIMICMYINCHDTSSIVHFVNVVPVLASMLLFLKFVLKLLSGDDDTRERNGHSFRRWYGAADAEFCGNCKSNGQLLVLK